MTTLDTIATERTPLDLAASLDAMHLAQTLDRADLATIARQTERKVSARLGSSLAADAAQSDALNRAIRNRANGLDLAHAINAAVRDAVRDAAERSARDSLASLDATDADGRSLADRLDDGSTSAARLSNYDEQAGIWRGVSRVPHPTDCLRPEMPSPEHLADMARDHIDANRLALLDACVAVNVAAQEQHRERIADLTAYIAQANADTERAHRDSRRALAASATTERRTAEEARRSAKKRPPVAGPRPVETVRAIAADPTYEPSGRIVANASRDLAETGATYWTHRHALAAQVLKLHATALDADATRARRNATAYAVIVSGWTRGQETAAQRLHRLAVARTVTRRQRRTADVPRRRTRPAWTVTVDLAAARRDQWHGRYAADNGQAQPTGHRPMMRLPMWSESYGLRRRLGLLHSTETAPDSHRRADVQPAPAARIPRHQPACLNIPARIPGPCAAPAPIERDDSASANATRDRATTAARALSATLKRDDRTDPRATARAATAERAYVDATYAGPLASRLRTAPTAPAPRMRRERPDASRAYDA